MAISKEILPYANEHIFTYKGIIILQSTVRTSHSHACVLSTYHTVVGLVREEVNVTLALEELSGPWGRQKIKIKSIFKR